MYLLSYRRIEKDTIHNILFRKFHKFRLYPDLVSSVWLHTDITRYTIYSKYVLKVRIVTDISISTPYSVRYVEGFRSALARIPVASTYFWNLRSKYC